MSPLMWRHDLILFFCSQPINCHRRSFIHSTDGTENCVKCHRMYNFFSGVQWRQTHGERMADFFFCTLYLCRFTTFDCEFRSQFSLNINFLHLYAGCQKKKSNEKKIEKGWILAIRITPLIARVPIVTYVLFLLEFLITLIRFGREQTNDIRTKK